MNPATSLYHYDFCIADTYNCPYRISTSRFSYEKGKAIGHLTSFEIPELHRIIPRDWRVPDPLEEGKYVGVVAVLEHLEWDGQAHNFLQLRGRVSQQNGQFLQYLFSKNRFQQDAILDLVVFEYVNFEKEKKEGYRTTFWSDKPLKVKIIDFRISANAVTDKDFYSYYRSYDVFSMKVLGIDPHADQDFESKQTLYCREMDESFNWRSNIRHLEFKHGSYRVAPFGTLPSMCMIKELLESEDVLLESENESIGIENKQKIT